MRERPILFSGPMVRAILAGRKTQTRRVVKPSPGLQRKWLQPETLHQGANARLAWADGRLGAQFDHPAGGPLTWVPSPHGARGDRLWVRETWSFIGDQGIWELSQAARWNCTPIYRADDAVADRWWPSIHMPRWASRITLEITDIRVERLNEISLQDVWAEGCEVRQFWLFGADAKRRQEIGAGVYRQLWEEINGAGSWAANPWVWVIEFRRAA